MDDEPFGVGAGDNFPFTSSSASSSAIDVAVGGTSKGTERLGFGVPIGTADIVRSSPKLIVIENAGNAPPARDSAAVRLAATAEESEREKTLSADADMLPL